MEAEKIRQYIAIAAASFIFLVFGIWELIDPQHWIGFVPASFYIFDPTILVVMHGIILTVLGIWIITGKWLRIAAIFGTLVMAQIVIALFILSRFSDLFVRDFTILLFVLSLAFEDNKTAKKKQFEVRI